MCKKVITLIDNTILFVSFLFILSSFFKILSISGLDDIICTTSMNLCLVFTIGVAISIALTPPLYREVLALRLPLEQWLQLHHLR